MHLPEIGHRRDFMDGMWVSGDGNMSDWVRDRWKGWLLNEMTGNGGAIGGQVENWYKGNP